MIRRPGWKDLSIGLFGAAGILAVALLILVYGRVGRLHGKTITLYATTNEARGVLSGTEVWLDGQKIGLVKDVVFRPPSVDPRQRLVMTLDVLDEARSHLRLDAQVQIRSGTSLIGDRVVYLSNADAHLRTVADGDTIHGGQQTTIEAATAEMTLASRQLPGIIESIKLLTAQLQTTSGTIGAFGVDVPTAGMADVRLRSTHLLSRVFNGDGTLGRTMRGSNALRTRATLAMAQADSIRTFLGSNEHSLGRFRRDSTLLCEIQRVRSELADVQQLASSPTGTIGRFRTDSVIVRNIHRDMAALDSLFADAKKHPFRYIIF